MGRDSAAFQILWNVLFHLLSSYLDPPSRHENWSSARNGTIRLLHITCYYNLLHVSSFFEVLGGSRYVVLRTMFVFFCQPCQEIIWAAKTNVHPRTRTVRAVTTLRSVPWASCCGGCLLRCLSCGRSMDDSHIYHIYIYMIVLFLRFGTNQWKT